MTEELTTEVKYPEVIAQEAEDIYEKNGIILYDSYEELIERAKGRLIQETQGVVWTRWTIGAHVKAVLDDAKYGSHVMEDLERDLGLAEKTLYACKRLFETYSREDMEERVMPYNPSFRALNTVVSIDDEEQREEYLKELAEGKITIEDINADKKALKEAAKADVGDGEITGTTATTAEPKSAEENAAAAIRKAIGAVDGPLDLIMGDIAAAEKSIDDLDIVAGDDDLYDKVTTELSDFQTKLIDLQPKVQSLLDRLNEVVV